MDSLLDRVCAYLAETGIHKTAFCRNVDISVTTLNRWIVGNLRLCDTTRARIDDYLRSFNR